MQGGSKVEKKMFIFNLREEKKNSVKFLILIQPLIIRVIS